MTTVQRPELASGTWVIDPVHSAVTFSVRHLALAGARGAFAEFSGQITVGDDPLTSEVRAEIAIPSLNTLNEARDGHLLSADFFDADNHPTAVFASTGGVQQDADGEYTVKGELTLKGVSKPVELKLAYNGITTNPQSNADTAGFSAVTEILRSDFGVGPVMTLPNGALAIADKVRIELEIEAVLAQ
ncbi:MAG: YceI family protein [Streptomycetaceae bacterium]|nr:YceI family protein [Streptomycetaceae bacterium]